MKFAVACLLAVMSGGCASHHFEERRHPMFPEDSKRPLRVAVLPVADRTTGDSVLDVLARPFLWAAQLITFSFPEDPPSPEAVLAPLRQMLIAGLETSHLHLAPTDRVDRILKANGLLEIAADTDPTILGPLLNVDAIVYASLHRFGSHYYVLQSSETVEVSASLRSVVDGQVLYFASARSTEQRGLSGGPTGYVSLVAEPLKALGGESYRSLAVNSMWRLARGLGSQREPTDEKKATRVEIHDVFVHPATEQPLKAGDRITVMASGTPEQQATFRIGNLHPTISMTQTHRSIDHKTMKARARYTGFYRVMPGDRIRLAPVTVTIGKPGTHARSKTAGAPITIEAEAPRTN